MIQEIMQQKNISIYRLAKTTGIPYTTVNDICNGRAHLGRCSAETVYRLAKGLGVSMESLLESCLNSRVSFELYRRNVRRRLMELGDLPFLAEALKQDDISRYYHLKWYPEALYLLAVVDYISRLNHIPLCEEYDDLRRCRLAETVYPAGILSVAAASGSPYPLVHAAKTAVSEFKHYNFGEREVRNVI